MHDGVRDKRLKHHDLTDVELRFVECLFAGKKMSEAAREIGVPYVTCRRWRIREDIKEELRSRKREAVHASACILSDKAALAAESLAAMATGGKKAVMADIVACKSVLEFAIKVVENEDLDRRLEAIEDQLRNGPATPAPPNESEMS